MRNSLQLHWLLLILLLPIFGGITLLLSVRTKDRVNRQIISGFDSKLSEIITLTDVFLDGDQHSKLARISEIREDGKLPPGGYNDRDPFYLKSVETFKQIRKETGLTYLYTLILLDQNNLCYILDGSEPKDFSPIGSLDVLPANFYDEMKASAKLDRSLIKPVEEWENWGLIKSGFIPIHQGDRQTAGFIGADLAVDIIRTREKQATLALMLSGALGIIISIFAAIRATRNLAHPINRLKAEVVQLAGGNLETPFETSDISEYAHLKNDYQTIRAAFIQLDQENREVINNQRLQEIETEYSSYLDSQLSSEYADRHTNLVIRDSEGSRAFSWVETNEGLLIWHLLRDDPEELLLSAKIRAITQGQKSLDFNEWVEALHAAGYLAKINLIGIDWATRQLSFHLRKESQIVRIKGDVAATLSEDSHCAPIPEVGERIRVLSVPEKDSTEDAQQPQRCLEIHVQP